MQQSAKNSSSIQYDKSERQKDHKVFTEEPSVNCVGIILPKKIE